MFFDSFLSGSRSASRTDKRPLSSYRTVPDTYAASPLFVPSVSARPAKPVNVVQPIGGSGVWPPPVMFPQRQATTPDPGKSRICWPIGRLFPFLLSFLSFPFLSFPFRSFPFLSFLLLSFSFLSSFLFLSFLSFSVIFFSFSLSLSVCSSSGLDELQPPTKVLGSFPISFLPSPPLPSLIQR